MARKRITVVFLQPEIGSNTVREEGRQSKPPQEPLYFGLNRETTKIDDIILTERHPTSAIPHGKL